MLTRKHGADICYTPMIHARLYSERDEAHCEKMFNTVGDTTGWPRSAVRLINGPLSTAHARAFCTWST